MIIQVNFGANDKEFITCSPEVGENIHKLREEFLTWIYDKNIDHKYWDYYAGEKYGVNFRTDAFIYWLSSIRFKNTNITAKLIDEQLVNNVEEYIFF